ncbi:uncharacterized protein HMPREF1541_08220 [Cyphellophora europaea CBS 101466]|uniref:Alpha/beta hydrolase fold-3 domain-containing protein n=1 Tax=Cyphellophora europaea (strain CBS 101466) TaxID=1220924 RepID=W2RLN2_CYPE1|nr:uncharacterized protein HMPREF1541_08220 [Cyphellophora europaea CBS 101466]ETN37230.1 hypothetical protein HMPREF1541_08220 [Cyphellophora europaea CBS 101466]
MTRQHVDASTTTAVQRKTGSHATDAHTLKNRSDSSSQSGFKPPSVSFTNVAEFENESTIDSPENFFENLPMRPRSLSHHLSAEKVPSRSWLRTQARFWRAMMSFAMHFHDMARPRPPRPAYKRRIPTDTIPIDLHFYLPPEYYNTLRQDPRHRFPCIVNFHGGGFSLGDARDDRYWARVAMKETNAVFVSVNYRRAPEHPFPTAVDDSADAILYISDHAADLHIDPTNIALSGFSAGANLVFSVPLRLAYHRKIKTTISRKSHPLPPFAPQDNSHLKVGQSNGGPFHSPFDTPSPTASRVSTHREEDPGHDYGFDDDNDNRPVSPISDSDDHSTHQPETPLNPPPQTRDFAQRPTPSQSTTSLMLMRTRDGAPIRITTIVAWYPLLDWTQSRSSKVRNSLNPPKTLPKLFTDLFDHAYLPPPDPAGSHASPYASPGLAPSHMLADALPGDIQLWLCEWDMLLKEGQTFSSRLEQLGKQVDTKLIPRVPHGWDKSPNPFRDQGAIDQLYEKAARGIHSAFTMEHGGVRSSASSVSESVVQRQPRGSVVLPL